MSVLPTSDDLGCADSVRRMRRPLLPVATAIALGLSLAACGGSDDDASGCSPVDSDVTVGATDELKFDADSYEAEAGCVRAHLRERGQHRPHPARSRASPDFKLSVGDTDTGTIELPAGTYELYCDIAGHEAAGMSADLSVS